MTDETEITASQELDIKQLIKDKSGIDLAPEQIEAIEAAIDQQYRLVSITGPAGTGKTKIIEIIYNILTELGYTVGLCAPTGKAAKRIQEVTGINAATSHRTLEYTHPGEIDAKTGKTIGFSYPRRDRENPLEYDVLLADEYAMTPRELHRNLLAALKHGGRIILIGDDNQLAPIEEEDNFKDKDKPKEPSEFVKCLTNPKLKSVKLKTVFRQGKDSGILANLEAILKGRVPRDNEQWITKYTDQPVIALQEHILENYFSDIDDDKKIDFSAVNNQIIVPQNVGWVGTIKLNFMIQSLYHLSDEDYMLIPRNTWQLGSYFYNANNQVVAGEKKGDEGGHIKIHLGDKVIITANNPDLQIFNGETGIVIEMSKEYGDITIDFGDREQTIPPIQVGVNKYGKSTEYDPRKSIDLAYAITTHKSQGSQYDHVVYIMNKSNTFMLSNRNIYTATSRAKLGVFVITDQQSLPRAIYKRS